MLLAWYSVREAAEDVVIEGVRIPKGTQIDLTLHAIHRSRQIWGDDVDEFQPDRCKQHAVFFIARL